MSSPRVKLNKAVASLTPTVGSRPSPSSPLPPVELPDWTPTSPLPSLSSPSSKSPVVRRTRTTRPSSSSSSSTPRPNSSSSARRRTRGAGHQNLSKFSSDQSSHSSGHKSPPSNLSSDQVTALHKILQWAEGASSIEQDTMTCDESGVMAAVLGALASVVGSPVTSPTLNQSETWLQRLSIPQLETVLKTLTALVHEHPKGLARLINTDILDQEDSPASYLASTFGLLAIGLASTTPLPIPHGNLVPSFNLVGSLLESLLSHVTDAADVWWSNGLFHSAATPLLSVMSAVTEPSPSAQLTIAATCSTLLLAPKPIELYGKFAVPVIAPSITSWMAGVSAAGLLRHPLMPTFAWLMYRGLVVSPRARSMWIDASHVTPDVFQSVITNCASAVALLPVSTPVPDQLAPLLALTSVWVSSPSSLRSSPFSAWVEHGLPYYSSLIEQLLPPAHGALLHVLGRQSAIAATSGAARRAAPFDTENLAAFLSAETQATVESTKLHPAAAAGIWTIGASIDQAVASAAANVDPEVSVAAMEAVSRVCSQSPTAGASLLRLGILSSLAEAIGDCDLSVVAAALEATGVITSVAPGAARSLAESGVLRAVLSLFAPSSSGSSEENPLRSSLTLWSHAASVLGFAVAADEPGFTSTLSKVHEDVLSRFMDDFTATLSRKDGSPTALAAGLGFIAAASVNGGALPAASSTQAIQVSCSALLESIEEWLESPSTKSEASLRLCVAAGHLNTVLQAGAPTQSLIWSLLREKLSDCDQDDDKSLLHRSVITAMTVQSPGVTSPALLAFWAALAKAQPEFGAALTSSAPAMEAMLAVLVRPRNTEDGSTTNGRDALVHGSLRRGGTCVMSLMSVQPPVILPDPPGLAPAVRGAIASIQAAGASAALGKSSPDQEAVFWASVLLANLPYDGPVAKGVTESLASWVVSEAGRSELSVRAAEATLPLIHYLSDSGHMEALAALILALEDNESNGIIMRTLFTGLVSGGFHAFKAMLTLTAPPMKALLGVLNGMAYTSTDDVLSSIRENLMEDLERVICAGLESGLAEEVGCLVSTIHDPAHTASSSVLCKYASEPSLVS